MKNIHRLSVSFPQETYEALEESARKTKKSNSQIVCEIVNDRQKASEENGQDNRVKALISAETMLSQIHHLTKLLIQDSTANMYRIGVAIAGFSQSDREKSRVEMATFVESRMKQIERELDAISEATNHVR